MEISGAAVLQRSPIFTTGRGSRFTDEGHLRYYVSPVKCGGRKEEKRRAKIVKELSKDLSAFYSIGFGVDAGGAAAEVKGKMMSEAADLLMSQLKQLKSEEKELKRKKKEQKAAMKAARMKHRSCDDSSSSESSCSECETVVRMNNLQKTIIADLQPEINTVPVATESCCGAVLQNKGPVATESCCGAVLQSNSLVTESCYGAVLQSNPTAFVMDSCNPSNGIPMESCKPVLQSNPTAFVMDSCNPSNDIPMESCKAVLQSNPIAADIPMESCGTVLKSNPIAADIPMESCGTVLKSNPIAADIPMESCGTVLKSNPIAADIPMESCGTVLKSNPTAEIPMERIEVCMGGKCKKSGAVELMAEFEKLVGEGAVVGCKCMGKCKDGPNVRVSKAKGKEEGDVRVPRNPLCIGVGLEDVGAIVANFFGEGKGTELLAD